MASASEIRSRIQSVRETKKITDAMYMVSSAKMRRALRELQETTPYFDALTEKIGELVHYIPQSSNRYLNAEKKRAGSTHGVLLLTADKGLVGTYNLDVIRACETYMANHPNTLVFIVGKYGRQYFSKRNIPFVQEFQYSAVHPNLTDARKICTDLLEYYDHGTVDDISIIYTDFVSTKSGQCKTVTLLPLSQTEFYAENKVIYPVEKEFLPSPDEVLNGIVPSYLMGFIYGCLVESFCSEQQARMLAMKNAGDNADDMLQTLRVQYNKTRQASITNEMIEIAADARALKRRGTSVSGDMYHEDE